MRRHARAVLTIALFLFSSLVWADVKLPAIISDNMALQQNMCVPIWGWADPGEAVTVCICNQTKSVCTCPDGKWIVKLSPMAAGGPHEMTVSGSNTIIIKNVLIGEVWVCSGQSNMEWVVNNSLYANAEKEAAKHPSIRLFTVKKNVQDNPVSDCTGKWVECSPASVGDFSAVGYFFGRTLYYQLQVPIGLIHTSWGGTPAEAWTTRATLEADPDLKPIMDRYAKAKADDTQFNWDKKMAEYKRAQDTYTHDTLVKWNAAVEKAKAENKAPPPRPNGPRAPQHALNANSPASLYNGMIAPIVPYGIAGATWYQGESNAGHAMQYRKLLPAMIRDWRNAWKQGDFPFMIVQLANYNNGRPRPKDPEDSTWAELREAQTLTALHTTNTGQGLAIDIGEAGDIHPKNKQDVGLRLALSALKIAYHRNIVYSGPMYSSMSNEGNAIRLHFTHTDGGLVARDGELKGFSIAGDDKKFVWAKARMEGDSIVVSSDIVAKPVAVRYAWADNPECNLYNKAGLPAVPFRTDDWKGITDGKN
jgi:sialate O-acetylesterase